MRVCVDGQDYWLAGRRMLLHYGALTTVLMNSPSYLTVLSGEQLVYGLQLPQPYLIYVMSLYQ